MTKDDSVYLRHVLDAIAKIEEYTKDKGSSDFHAHTLLQDGVIRQVEIIGEATKRVSKKLREKHPQVAWEDITGMRDKLAHDYLGVDIDQVWLTIQTDIPTLRGQVIRILKQIED